MEFRIADTFTDSLARLTGEEQKAVRLVGKVFWSESVAIRLRKRVSLSRSQSGYSRITRSRHHERGPVLHRHPMIVKAA